MTLAGADHLQLPHERLYENIPKTNKPGGDNAGRRCAFTASARTPINQRFFDPKINPKNDAGQALRIYSFRMNAITNSVPDLLTYSISGGTLPTCANDRRNDRIY